MKTGRKNKKTNTPQEAEQQGKKENVELPTFEKTTITQVRNTFNKWLEMKNDWIVDLCCATAINKFSTTETSLWFFIIGTSGISKTAVVKAFVDPYNICTKNISRLSKNTLITGNPKFPDLAPKLKGKLMLTLDMATFVQMKADEKGSVWAQMRELYDGFASRQTGSGTDVRYTDLAPLPWLFCSTPIIDNELLMAQVLGSRELIFRIWSEWFNDDNVMEKIWNNHKQSQKMSEELNKVIYGLITNIQEVKDYTTNISTENKANIFAMAKLITMLRAAGEVDPFTGDLQGFVYPEKPTRVLKQLMELYNCLMSLDDNYPEERAFEILQHVVISSIHPIRVKVLEELVGGEEKSISEISRAIGLGWKTVKRELNILKGLKVVVDEEQIFDHEEKEMQTGKYKWKLTLNEDAKIMENFIIEYQELLEKQLSEFQITQESGLN